MPTKPVGFVGTSMGFHSTVNLFQGVSDKKQYQRLWVVISAWITALCNYVMSAVYGVRALPCIRLLPSLVELLRPMQHPICLQ